MDDEALPQPTGNSLLSPVVLTSEQEELCRRLDDLHNQHGLKASPSNMFRGAIYAARAECRSNTDWISQAANSLREILYPFWSRQVKSVAQKKDIALKRYGAVLVDASDLEELGRVYGKLNDLAHHGSESRVVNFSTFTISDFEKLTADFERCMRNALTRQVDIHAEMDRILSASPSAIIDDVAPQS
jgi:hypothetical protein